MDKAVEAVVNKLLTRSIGRVAPVLEQKAYVFSENTTAEKKLIFHDWLAYGRYANSTQIKPSELLETHTCIYTLIQTNAFSVTSIVIVPLRCKMICYVE